MDKTRYPVVRMSDEFWMLRHCEKRRNIATGFHYHEAVEIYFLIEGRCRFFIDGSFYELTAGDIAVIPPHLPHKAYYEKDEPVTRYVMNCELSLLSEKTGGVLISSDSFVKRLKTAAGEAEILFQKMKKEYDHPDAFSVEVVKSCLSLLAAMVCRNPSESEITPAKSKSRFVDAAIDYLKANYSGNLSLRDVAEHVSVSYVHLSRAFKAETGFGPNEFLNLYRLRQAKFMLLECPSKSVSQIAYDCGFNDSNYFAVKFKRLFGITPTEFRLGKKSDKSTLTFFVK